MRLNDFDLLKVIHPSVKLDKTLIERLNSVKKVLSWHDLLFLDESYKRWLVYFLALISQSNVKQNGKICSRFELSPEDCKIICRDRFEAERCIFWLERSLPVSDSQLYRRLIDFKTELILYMMAATKKQRVKKAISRFFTKLRRVGIALKGRDLKEMQLKPGPIYREVLQAVLDARLDGKLKTKNDELDYARRYIAGR